MDSNTGIYLSLLLTGAMGSLGHCLGMCGPLVLMVGAQFRSGNLQPLPAHLGYQGARIGIYALLGAMVGLAGSWLGFGKNWTHFAGVASLLLGLGVVLLGMGYLGWLPVRRLEGGGQWVGRAMSEVLQRRGLAGAILMGGLNGLLPCGLVYSALLMTSSAGGILPGAVGMLVFGIGTLPALLLVSLGPWALSAGARQTLSRLAGLFIALVGGQMILRGLAALGFIQHLKLGGLMLW
jgi:sulfite exporter TauE/SafE